ncbi:MAG: hypothetical protein ACKOWF_18065 [Chloroflexota bacterium]
MTDSSIRSRCLPGGDLVRALFDRNVMGLADRGGASNLVGARWADLVAEAAAAWEGEWRPVPGEASEMLCVEPVERLDATPQVAAIASKRGLQNPDLLLIGSHGGGSAVQAADAKFSVETARAKQVSPEVVEALLGLRDELPGVFGGIDGGAARVPGVFVCPDYPLTHIMLNRRQGIVRSTVRPDEVVLVPTDPSRFFAPLEGSEAMIPLATVDRLPVTIDESLLAGLYYFRLARAAAGCWLDANRPLLNHDDHTPLDPAALAAETRTRCFGARDAYGVILAWNDDVETVRRQRSAVDQVAQVPISNRDLRSRVEKVAAAHGAPQPPSLNQVRRRLTGWWRGELRDRVGAIPPPVADLPAELLRVAAAGHELEPMLPARIERVVAELVAPA